MAPSQTKSKSKRNKACEGDGQFGNKCKLPQIHEAALIEAHKEKLNTKIRKAIDIYLQMSSLKLIKAEDKRTCILNPPLNGLCFDNMFKIPSKDPSFKEVILNKRSLRLIVFTISSYLMLKLLILTVNQHERDALIGAVKPKVRPDANRTSKCAFVGDIYYDDESKLSRLVNLTDWIGNPMISLTGGAVSVIASRLTYAFLFYYCTMIYLFYYKLQVDHLGFLYYPTQEFQRFKIQLKSLIEEFGSRGSNTMVLNQGVKSSGQYEWYKEMMNDMSEGKQIYHAGPNNQQFNDKTRNNYSNELFDRIKLLDGRRAPSAGLRLLPMRTSNFTLASEVLAEPNFPNLIQPNNLTVEAYSKLINIYRLALVNGFSIMLYGGATLTSGYIVLEIVARVRQRFLQLECLNWMPNGGTPANEFIRLRPLELASEKEAYQTYDISSRAYIGLSLIEAKYLFTTRTIISLLEFQVFNHLNCIWVLFFVAILFASFKDKTIWLEQIEAQVRNCIGLLVERQQYYTKVAGSMDDYYIEHRHEAAEEEKRRRMDKILMSSLLVTYFNYELFRRHHQSFKNLINFLLVYPLIITVLILALCYYLGTHNSEANNPAIISTALNIVLFNNLFLYTCSKYTKKSIILMREIMRLISNAPQHNSAQFSEIMKFWRYQVLSETDSKHFYSPNILGIHVSFKLMMNLNMYLGLLWWILRGKHN